MSEATILKGQLKLYSEESWKTEHKAAMYCRDIEDAIALGLSIMERIRARSSKYEHIDETECRCNAMCQWLEASLSVLDAVAALRREEYEPTGANLLQAKVDEVSCSMPRIYRIMQSISEIKAGRGLSLAEAMNVLRDHNRTERNRTSAGAA